MYRLLNNFVLLVFLSACSFQFSMEDIAQELKLAGGGVGSVTLTLPTFINKISIDSVPISGSCSTAEAANVEISYNSIIQGQFPCVNGSFSGHFVGTGMAQGSQEISARLKILNPNSESTINYSDTITGRTFVDTIDPTAPSSSVDGAAISSLSSTATFVINGSADTGSGVQKYQVRIIRVIDNFVIREWVDHINGLPELGLILDNNTVYKLQLRAVDYAGNYSSIVETDGWLTDTSPPLAISRFQNFNYSSTSSTPLLEWDSTTDAESGVQYYQVAIGSGPSLSDVVPWTNLPTPSFEGIVARSTLSGIGLTNGNVYYPSIRAVDRAGNISSELSAASFRSVEVWKNQNLSLPSYTIGDVNTSVVQSDGKKIIGGNFTRIGGYPFIKVGCLNSNGGPDTSFLGTGFNGDISTIAIQSDGKILLAGNFTQFKNIIINRLIRLNADGSYDSSFNIGSGFDGRVRSLAIRSNGKILVGGSFTQVNGNNITGLVQLNSDGTIDTSFDVGVGFSFLAMINDIGIQSDGKIIVGGAFSTYKGSFNQIALMRINVDGSPDASFNVGTSFDSSIDSVSIQVDDKILVSGAFTTYQGSAQNRLIRLNTDGSKDTGFNIGTGFNSSVFDIYIQNDGKILVGGAFTTYQGSAQNRLIRLNTDGSKDTGFNIGTGSSGLIFNIFTQSNGSILVAGSFASFNGTTVNGLVRLTSTGSIDSTLDTALGFDSNTDVRVVKELSNGKLIVGGGFAVYQGNIQNYIARIKTDGTTDASFNIGTGFDQTVNVIALQANGKILVGGFFTTYKGLAQNKLIRLNSDGSKDATFNIGTGFSGPVYALAIQSDGKILVGGSFVTYQGSSWPYLVRLNVDGSIDSGFNIGTGFNQMVTSIAIKSNGKILVGGWFSDYIGVNQNNIVLLNSDGSLDASFNPGTNLSGAVRSILIQSDGKYILGGDFPSYGGSTVGYIVRLSTDGSLDTSWNVGSGFNGSVKSLVIQSDGKILVGGSFTSYNGSNLNAGLARLNQNGSFDSSMNVSLMSGSVMTILMLSSGKIFIGGSMNMYNNLPSGSQMELGW